MKIITIIGARPQIIKAAALTRAIKQYFTPQIQEVIVHTGQHYDHNMSQVFFDELEIPTPRYNLNIGSATHGAQTAGMIEGIERILMHEQPDYIVLYGDTNSTLAGAIAASKIHVPIVHIEAGLRSFNKSMPEEINRIVCDHCSTLLFSPTATGYKNLLMEGFSAQNLPPYSPDNPAIFHCGDVMYDNSIYYAEKAERVSNILQSNNLEKNKFILCTIHRNSNTDDPKRLNSIFDALLSIERQFDEKIFIPLHPRTSKLLKSNLKVSTYNRLLACPSVIIAPPASFLDMILLEKHASLVITDSGGVQKEAYFFGKNCIILRSETEWKEIVEIGAAKIADADEKAILMAFKAFRDHPNKSFPKIFGNGQTAHFICNEMLKGFAVD